MAEPALVQTRNSPAFKVLLSGGHELPSEAALDILDVKVCDYLEGASTFSVTMNIWDSAEQKYKWIDDTLLGEGTELEIRVGYADSLKTMIVGEVTSLEPEFPEGEARAMKVHGYDLLHRFRRGRKTRSFVKMKDSDIASQIARELNLRTQVDDTQVTHEYVLQNNQTDIDFLLERARRIRYEVVIEDKTLRFRKAANDKGQVVSLEYGFTLRSFYPRLSTMQQVSEVVVQGWDPKTKKAIAGRARQGDELSKMNGSKLGFAISEQAFFKSETVIVDKPIYSEGEALQIAKGKFNDMTVAFITGEGLATGNTDIQAGQVIELKKLGKRFSGLYYVTSATHMVDQTGYTTKFTVQRNAT
jgi:phage protein D